MAIKLELLKLIDEFVEQNKGSWNHANWLEFLEKIKGEGYSIPENELGKLAEDEKDYFEVSCEGVKLIPVAQLAGLCQQFLAENNGDYSDKEWLLFLSKLSNLGYYSKHYVESLIETQKEEMAAPEKKEPASGNLLEKNYRKNNQIGLLKRSVKPLKEKISALNGINTLLHPDSDAVPISMENTLLPKEKTEYNINKASIKDELKQSQNIERLKPFHDGQREQFLTEKINSNKKSGNHKESDFPNRRQLGLLKRSKKAWEKKLSEKSAIIEKEEIRIKQQTKNTNNRTHKLMIHEPEPENEKKRLSALKRNPAEKASLIKSEQERALTTNSKEARLNADITSLKKENMQLKLELTRKRKEEQSLKEYDALLEKKYKDIEEKKIVLQRHYDVLEQKTKEYTLRKKEFENLKREKISIVRSHKENARRRSDLEGFSGVLKEKEAGLKTLELHQEKKDSLLSQKERDLLKKSLDIGKAEADLAEKQKNLGEREIQALTFFHNTERRERDIMQYENLAKEKERELLQKESGLKEKYTVLRAAEKKIKEENSRQKVRSSENKLRESKLNSFEKILLKKNQDLAGVGEKLKAERKDLSDCQKKLDAQELALNKQESRISIKSGKLEQKSNEFNMKINEIHKLEAINKKERQDIENLKAAMKQWEDELTEKTGYVVRINQKMELNRRKLKNARNGMLRKLNMISKREQMLKNEKLEFSRRKEQLAIESEKLKTQVEEERLNLNNLRRQVKDIEVQSEIKKALLEKKAAEDMQREITLKNAENELFRGKEHLDMLKSHYAAELSKLEKSKSEIQKYKESVEKIKEFVEKEA